MLPLTSHIAELNVSSRDPVGALLHAQMNNWFEAMSADAGPENTLRMLHGMTMSICFPVVPSVLYGINDDRVALMLERAPMQYVLSQRMVYSPSSLRFRMEVQRMWKSLVAHVVPLFRTLMSTLPTTFAGACGSFATTNIIRIQSPIFVYGKPASQ